LQYLKSNEIEKRGETDSVNLAYGRKSLGRSHYPWIIFFGVMIAIEILFTKEF
jgi:hypothetical protein